MYYDKQDDAFRSPNKATVATEHRRQGRLLWKVSSCTNSVSLTFLLLCVATPFLLRQQEQKQRILDKYGGSEHLDVPDARLLVGQTESYVEYDRTGRVVKGAPKVIGW